MPPAATTSARRHHHGPCHRAATMGRDVRPVLGWTYNRVMRHGRGQSVKGGPLLSLFSDFGRQVHTVRGSHTLYVLAVPWCTVLRHLRAATSTARQYTVSTARADTLSSPIHRCHDHLAPLPPPRISSPSRRIHHHHRPRHHCRHLHRHHPTSPTILRSWCCAVPSRYVPCTGHPGSSKAGAAGDGGSRAAGVAAAPVDGVGRQFTVGDGQYDEKVRRCHGQIGISHADG